MRQGSAHMRRCNAARTLVIQITPRRLASRRMCCDALRRELLHAADVVNPRFAFRRDDLLGGSPQENLVRDRYHVLWRVNVEGRLLRERRLEQPAVDAILRAASCVFSGAGASNEDVEQGIADFLRRDDATHPELLAAAGDPNLLCAAADARSGAGPLSGDGGNAASEPFSATDHVRSSTADSRSLVTPMKTGSRR